MSSDKLPAGKNQQQRRGVTSHTVLDLPGGYVAVMSLEDHARVAGLRWRVALDRYERAQAFRWARDGSTGAKVRLWLPNDVLGLPASANVLCLDGFGMNCRRENLHAVEAPPGVSWDPIKAQWRVRLHGRANLFDDLSEACSVVGGANH